MMQRCSLQVVSGLRKGAGRWREKQGAGSAGGQRAGAKHSKQKAAEKTMHTVNGTINTKGNTVRTSSTGGQKACELQPAWATNEGRLPLAIGCLPLPCQDTPPPGSEEQEPEEG